MVVAFTNPAGRGRLALYKSRDYILDILESETAVQQNAAVVRTLEEALSSGTTLDDSPAVSIEPKNYVDFTQQFYVLPILEAEEVFLSDGFSARLLKIASVSVGESSSAERQAADEVAQPDPRTRRKFKTGIAFVVDSTASMGPYIDQMRAAIERIYTTIDEAGQQQKVAFGLVAFRDNVEAAPASNTYRKYLPTFHPER